jgi:hypothetical protein
LDARLKRSGMTGQTGKLKTAILGHGSRREKAEENTKHFSALHLSVSMLFSVSDFG